MSNPYQQPQPNPQYGSGQYQYGQHQPQQHYPGVPASAHPVKKRKKWPWIVGGLVALIVVLSAISAPSQAPSGNSGDTANTAGSSQENTGSGQGTTGENESKVVRLTFGQTHTWRGGEAITVSKPREYTASNRFLKAPEGKRYVAFDVTITNNGDDEYNVMAVKLTVQHNGQVAQQNYAAGDVLPDVQLPPGGSTTFTSVYEIGDATGKLQVSVQPNVFAVDTVYFTGKF